MLQSGEKSRSWIAEFVGIVRDRPDRADKWVGSVNGFPFEHADLSSPEEDCAYNGNGAGSLGLHTSDDC